MAGRRRCSRVGLRLVAQGTGSETGGRHQVHDHYRLPLPHDGEWREVLNSDAQDYGGSGIGNLGQVNAEGGAAFVVLPPLATLILEFQG